MEIEEKRIYQNMKIISPMIENKRIGCPAKRIKEMVYFGRICTCLKILPKKYLWSQDM
jgi:hypothetical protein